MAALVIALPFSPSTPLLADQPVARQIQQQAITLAGTTSVGPDDDLRLLRQAFHGAQIIEFGEGSHGTREFWSIRQRLFRFLVYKMGFRVLVVEASWSDTLSLDNYVTAGQGTARVALYNLNNWTLDTSEMLDFVEWMRRYKLRHPHDLLHVAGIDMQQPAGAQAIVESYLAGQRPERLREALMNYSCFDSAHPDRIAALPRNTRSQCLKKAESVREMLNDFASNGSARPRDYNLAKANHAAEIVAEAVAFYGGLGDRERALAQNTRWIETTAFRGQRILVCAHNGHVAAVPVEGEQMSPMGKYLRQWYGRSLFVIASTFDRGQILAVPVRDNRLGSSVEALNVESASPGTSESVLRLAGPSALALTLRDIAADSTLGRWLDSPRPIRMIGGLYYVGDPSEARIRLTDAFDALVFISVSHATHPLAPPSVSAHQ